MYRKKVTFAPYLLVARSGNSVVITLVVATKTEADSYQVLKIFVGGEKRPLCRNLRFERRGDEYRATVAWLPQPWVTEFTLKALAFGGFPVSHSGFYFRWPWIKYEGPRIETG